MGQPRNNRICERLIRILADEPGDRARVFLLFRQSREQSLRRPWRHKDAVTLITMAECFFYTPSASSMAVFN